MKKRRGFRKKPLFLFKLEPIDQEFCNEVMPF